MAHHTLDDPIGSEVSPVERAFAQEAFGREIIERRNAVAVLIRNWIETDEKFPIPIYDRLIERLRHLDGPTRSDIASVALLMADEMTRNILETFDRDRERVANYAIVAQMRRLGAAHVTDEIDINRGNPRIGLTWMYKRWLSRFAPSELRAGSSRTVKSNLT